jgi:PAS domain S-box-containing protein
MTSERFWDIFLPNRHAMPEKDVRLAELFAAALMVLIVAAILLISVPLGVFWRKFTIVGGLGIGGIGGVLALRRGHVGFAATIAVFVSWAALTFASATGGGVYSPAFSAYLFINLIIGLVFGVKGALIALGLTLLSGFGILLSQQAGLLPTSLAESTPENVFLINSVLQLVCTALVIVLTRMMSKFSSRVDEEQVARRKIQVELEKSESKFRAMVAGSHDVTTVHDAQGRIMYASPSTVRVLGYQPEFMIGKTPIEFVVPEDKALIAKDLGEVARGVNDGRPTEFRFRRADGVVVALESVGHNHLHNPAIEGLIINTRDITDRRKAEESLRQSERLFRDVFEHSPVGIMLVSLEGKILRTNARACQLIRYTEAELRGMTVYDFTHPDDFELTRRMLDTLRKPENLVLPIQKRYIAKDGSVVWVEGVTTPVRDNTGTVQYVISHLQDIGERLKAEERLLSSLKEKEVLLKEIHHRVKNNLQVISSLLNLQSSSVVDPAMRSLFSESQNRIRSMALIHEVLYRSNDLAAVPFGEYSRMLFGRLITAHAARNIRSEIDVQDFVLGIDQAIPGGLILNEFVTNALKHGFPDGRPGSIRLQVAAREGHCVICVKDDGIGLPHGFDPAGAGTLGMQLVTSLTSQLEGRLEIASSNPGATFKLSFPAVG